MKASAIWLGLSFTLGCESPRVYDATNTVARSALRAEAVGCWTLFTEADSARAADGEPAPALVRLDTIARKGADRGYRIVRRLDTLGHVLTQDVESITLLDEWSADSASDSIRLTFHNGLYGSHVALEFPQRRDRMDTLRGRRQSFGDAEPPVEYPIVHAVATRIACRVAADSVSGG